MNIFSSLVFGIGVILLALSVIWFIVLYETANPLVYNKPDVVQHTQNKTQNTIIDYAYELKMPSVYFHKSDDQTIHAIIDVGGIITAVIGGSVSMILSRLVNRYFPEKRKR